MKKKLLFFVFFISSSLVSGMEYWEKKSWQYKFNKACEKGDLKKIKGIVKKYPSSCSQLKDGELKKSGRHGQEKVYMPLHSAASYGHEGIVKYLIDSNLVDKNAQDKEGNAPIHVAAYAKKFNIIKLLIENYGVDPTISGKDSYTPAHYAIVANDLVSLSYLIEKGVSVDNFCSEGTLLELVACHKTDVSLARFLINHEADIGITLHLAVQKDHLPLIKFLIEEANIRLYEYDNNQKTAWEYGDRNTTSMRYIFEYILDQKVNDTNVFECPICFENKTKQQLTITDYHCLSVICIGCKRDIRNKNNICPFCDISMS